MKKELPSIYKNPIDHPVKNNKQTDYVSKNYNNEIMNRMINDEKANNVLLGKDIVQKIYSIFQSSHYIYKAKVEIKTKDGIFVTNVIGKNKDTLITINNEQIPISEIIDIKMVNEKTSN